MILSRKQSLSGDWQFRQSGGDDWHPAQVPGGVHTDLLAAGLIDDPFVGDEEKRVQWVAKQDWDYRRSFTVDQELLEQTRVQLVCDGLDTLAEVRLNGQVIGGADNMFTPYRWNVREVLREGENELEISFLSPVQYTSAMQVLRPMPDVNNPLPGGSYLRKAPSHFGWDWGPQIPAVGIWRDIRLEGFSTARLADVALRQQHDNGTVQVTATVEAEIYDEALLTLTLTMTAPDGQVQTAEAPFATNGQVVGLTVEDPQLWWPNGYGDQALYGVTVALSGDAGTLDEWNYQLGLRTVELRQEPDEWGTSFTFLINGVPVFAKGSNWIPADSFPTRITHAQLDHLLGSAAMAHHNMVRVWGGGYYEDEYFYDLCDRLGLLVWQDFMFACSGYPLDDEALLSSIKGEVVANVRRLRHRASLALWCGNNEIETAWESWGWNKPEWADLIASYERFFFHTLPVWVAAEDPATPYWSSSPSSGDFMHDSNGDRAGDVHQWAVWHANKPFSNYRTTLARFVSEFGFQSIPSLETVRSFAAPENWNITSYIMEHHQRSPVGNEKIVLYLLENFRLPKDFPSLIYVSQILQAEAMRYGVEGWRRHPATMGALYWQLNDCWPVISWAGIDYYGRWKALHYSSRRFYSPVLLSIEDEGTNMGVFVTSEKQEQWEGEVRWSLQTLSGDRVQGGTIPVSVGPLSTEAVFSRDFADVIDESNRRQVVLYTELWQDGDLQQTALGTFAPTKHLDLADPQLEVQVAQEGEDVLFTLEARSLARFVELEIAGADVIFSDNYFDLPAGQQVSVACPLPQGWSVEDVVTALRVRSVFDSF